MARYTGPRSRISRRFGIPIFGPCKALERKNYPPGAHGEKRARKQSEYGFALGEKQKLRYTYGILERQFRRYFEMARQKRGVTGDIMLQLLETRLDNVVYRLGLANTRRYARQMVGHGHVLVNGRRVTIASYQVRPGDEVALAAARTKTKAMGERNVAASSLSPVPTWLELDKDNFKGRVSRYPTRDDIQSVVNDQVVVELYSR